MDTTKSDQVRITECPRDAMQGLHDFVPTSLKIDYLQVLLAVGFDVLDFGSFVSPKAIPNLADTAEVIKGLDLSETKTELLTIVANERGALQATQFDEVSYLGFPFSISDTFQLRNTNATLEEAESLVGRIAEICDARKKKPMIYLSMAFGNPYGDVWRPEIVAEWVGRLNSKYEIKQFALSDTIGNSNRKTITDLFGMVCTEYPKVTFGAHFHTVPHSWQEKVEAALDCGCRNFDGALKGFGGCPMAEDELTGNMPTEKMVGLFEERGMKLSLNKQKFENALMDADKLFSRFN